MNVPFPVLSRVSMRKRQGNEAMGERSPTKGAVQARIRQMLTLERICTRFHAVAGQLQSRHAGRETLRVSDEHDVCDLLRALLTLEYDDIRAETWRPGYLSGGSRTDFVLKLEQIVVEAKKTRPGLGAKELGEELAADVQKHRQHADCRTLVCFVYDPDGLIPDPRELEHQLSGERDGLTRRVIVAPRRL